MKERAERFRLIRHVWGGKKWFEDMETGRIALCDDSGDTPDRADDGVVWLSQGDLIVIRVNDAGPVDEHGLPKEYEPPFVRIPTLVPDWQSLRSAFTGGSVDEWLWIASEFGLEIVMQYESGKPGYRFKVTGHRVPARKGI